MDGAFPKVTRRPFDGFNIIKIKDALCDSGAKGKTGIV
jgi:hypothetical protein